MKKVAALLMLPILLGACERHPVSDLHKIEDGLVPSKAEGAESGDHAEKATAEKAPAKAEH